MTREVWFKEDIGQVLLAVGEASRSACAAVLEGGQGGEPTRAAGLVGAYQAGFQAALQSLALAFGLLDVAGSLPRTWVTALEEEPVEGVWYRVVEPGAVACSGERNTTGPQQKTDREWLEEEWR